MHADTTCVYAGPLLANKPQAQPAGATISTGFSPNNAPPAVVASRLSFSGTPLLMPDQLAKHSPLIPAGQPLQGLSGGIQQIKPAAAAVPAIPAAPAVPALALSSEKVESESAPWSSRSTEGVHTELLSPRESSAGTIHLLATHH